MQTEKSKHGFSVVGEQNVDELGDGHYWKGLSWEQRCRLRRELLSAAPEELASLADVLGRVLDGGGVCVIGPRDQLERCGLDTILPV